MKRRRFVQSSIAASTALTANFSHLHVAPAQAPQSFAAGENPVLVAIYLRGGQDQLNTIIPHNDSRYYEIRPNIALPQEKVIRLDDQWALHPAMAPLKRMYDERKFAIVVNAGSPHPTRSHFDAQDFMEYAAPGDRTVRDGWLNRFLSATIPQANDVHGLPELRALAMQELLPRSVRGRYPVVAVPNNLEKLAGVLDLFEDFYGAKDVKNAADALKRVSNVKRGIEADPVMVSGQETVHGLRRLRQLLYGGAGDAVEDESIGSAAVQEYPGGYFANRMQGLARVIKAGVGLEVATIDINGWDHHIGLGSDDGALNDLLTFLSASIAAFMSDLGPHLERTVILVCTEFGRVCEENGNDGADHGHGGPMWLLGGGVQGGKVYGNWTGLDQNALYQKRDLPVTTDFRAVFAEVLERHMQFEVPADFFPKYKPPKTRIGLFV